MKFLSFIAGFAAVAFFSCTGNEVKTTSSTDTVSSVATDTLASQTPAPSGPFNMMLIKHKVADFNKWKPIFDSHESARAAMGLHSYVVGRGVDNDSNTVFIALRMDDVEKAKAFAKDTALKARMKESGVRGEPTFNYTTIEWMDSSRVANTLRLVSSYKVKDWDTWKTAFEANRQWRLDNGLMDRVEAHDVDDKNMVTIAFAVRDAEKAKAFMSSAERKKRMAEAGVIGQPTTFYYHVVQKY